MEKRNKRGILLGILVVLLGLFITGCTTLQNTQIHPLQPTDYSCATPTTQDIIGTWSNGIYGYVFREDGTCTPLVHRSGIWDYTNGRLHYIGTTDAAFKVRDEYYYNCCLLNTNALYLYDGTCLTTTNYTSPAAGKNHTRLRNNITTVLLRQDYLDNPNPPSEQDAQTLIGGVWTGYVLGSSLQVYFHGNSSFRYRKPYSMYDVTGTWRIQDGEIFFNPSLNQVREANYMVVGKNVLYLYGTNCVPTTLIRRS